MYSLCRFMVNTANPWLIKFDYYDNKSDYKSLFLSLQVFIMNSFLLLSYVASYYILSFIKIFIYSHFPPALSTDDDSRQFSVSLSNFYSWFISESLKMQETDLELSRWDWSSSLPSISSFCLSLSLLRVSSSLARCSALTDLFDLSPCWI